MFSSLALRKRSAKTSSIFEVAVEFCKLVVGDLFMHDGMVAIKINRTQLDNAVVIKTKEVISVNHTQQVQPAKFTIIGGK